MGVTTAGVVIEEFTSDTDGIDRDIPKGVGDVISRDRWGRPLIKPPGGKGRAVGYTRASSLGKVLTDDKALKDWSDRMVAAGMAQRPDLVALAAAKLNRKRDLQQVAQDAKEYARAGERANLGTAMHGFIEAHARGENVGPVPVNLQPDIDAYNRAIAEWRVIESELFVVEDELQVAGTLDLLLGRPRKLRGGKVIGDLKTGENAIKYGQLEIAVQLAIYAHGKVYDPATGRRTPTGADLVDGYVFWLPVGQGVCEVHRVDLVQGWEAAKQAIGVKEVRKAKNLFTKVGEVDLVDVQRETRKAKTVDDVREVYSRLIRCGNDKAMVEEACRARIENFEKAAKAAERKAAKAAEAGDDVDEMGGDDDE